MNNLVKITENNGQKAINARDLWTFLESKRDFSNWINYQIEKFNLIENKDFLVFNKNVENLSGGRPEKEYVLEFITAIQIVVASNSKKANEFRSLLIDAAKNKTLQVESKKFARFKTKNVNGVIYVNANNICQYKPYFNPLKWLNKAIEVVTTVNELNVKNIPVVMYFEDVYFHIDIAIILEKHLYKYETPTLYELKENEDVRRLNP